MDWILIIGVHEPLLLIKIAGSEAWKVDVSETYRVHVIQVLIDLFKTKLRLIAGKYNIKK